MQHSLQSPAARCKLFTVRVNAVEAVDCNRAGHPAAYSAYSPAMLSTQATKHTNTTIPNKTQIQIQTQTQEFMETQKYDAIPTSTKWDQPLDDFPNVFNPPSIPHPRAT